MPLYNRCDEIPDGAMIAPMEMESPQCACLCADGLAMDSGTEQYFVKENGLLQKNIRTEKKVS